MIMDLDPRHASTLRSSNGCWTCRVRRKKCDKRYPVCEACAALHITCHHGLEKPEWMDSGAKQEEMVEQLKREVKEKAHRRRGERAAQHVPDSVNPIHSISPTNPITEPVTSDLIVLPQSLLSQDLGTPVCDLLKSNAGLSNTITGSCPEAAKFWLQRGSDCKLAKARESLDFGRSDTILLMFYLEHLLPFIFPFYRPSLLQGGRAWILEMMLSSPVVRQATLCQSSYFFSLARGTAVNRDVAWETVLAQAKDAFEVLRQSLQVIDRSGVTEHLHGAVRIMASIMQVQRFEIAVLSFNNCQAHLSAALALFKQLLESVGVLESAGPSASFKAVLNRLGPASWILSAQSVQVPSAEQAAFRFSSALLVLDDIIASTVLQEQPRLYEYHRSFLCSIEGAEPLIDLEGIIGCQNWVLLQIGEISVLDAWKQRCKRAGNLDVMELVHRATAIKVALESHLTQLETDTMLIRKESSSLLDLFTADSGQQSMAPSSQVSLVTRVWAHAALIYLSVVVSGWQPASFDARYHVGRIIELLSNQISPSELIRTMVWPFCVAGCLAEPSQDPHLRKMAEELQPPSVFGTVRKALDIMELVWSNRDVGDATNRDLGAIFRSQGDLVLLV